MSRASHGRIVLELFGDSTGCCSFFEERGFWCNHQIQLSDRSRSEPMKAIHPSAEKYGFNFLELINLYCVIFFRKRERERVHFNEGATAETTCNIALPNPLFNNIVFAHRVVITAKICIQLNFIPLYHPFSRLTNYDFFQFSEIMAHVRTHHFENKWCRRS